MLVFALSLHVGVGVGVGVGVALVVRFRGQVWALECMCEFVCSLRRVVFRRGFASSLRRTEGSKIAWRRFRVNCFSVDANGAGSVAEVARLFI